MSTVTAIEPSVGSSLADLLDLLGRTSDAMIAVDGDLRVIAWNDAATKLLGHQPSEVLGRPCYEILCWRNRCGDTLCDASCPSAWPGEPDEIIETRDVLGRSATNETLWLSASTIVPPADLRDQCRLIHLVREIGLPPELERLIAERVGGVRPPPPRDDLLDALTPREREVLDLLAEGLDGPAIAGRLFVSPATVRNHIQHILTKLGVHSRVEAIARVLRNR